MLCNYYRLDGSLIYSSKYFDLIEGSKLKNFTGYIEVPYWDVYEIHYYKNSLVHREDGPAIIRHDNSKEYWLNNKKIKTQEQFQLLVDIMKLKSLL